jgi:hypothetical protein
MPIATSRIVQFATIVTAFVSHAATVCAQSLDEPPTYNAASADASTSDASVAQGEQVASTNGVQNSSTSTIDEVADGRPISSASEGSSRTASRANVTLGGYAETFWQYNFNQPFDGTTHNRAFDSVHNGITISNVVLDAQWSWQRVTGRIALQVGHTADLMYADELSAVGPTTAAMWRLLQQAWIAYRAPIGRGLLFEAGLFLSPIGPEGMPVKDQWNWSRSNLFSALPYYHTGVRATYALGRTMALSVGGYNGWNKLFVDNNAEKSLSVQWTYNRPDHFTASVLYFSGNERNLYTIAGRGWRHTFDSYAQWTVTSWLSLMAHANGGFEPVFEGEPRGASRYNGTQWWFGAALYARVQPVRWLYLAVRGDYLTESLANRPTDPATMALSEPAPIVTAQRTLLNDPAFSPLGSVTATADFRPHDNLSLRVEYRHDESSGFLFSDNTRFLPTADPRHPGMTSAQNTLTLGATAWY